MEVAEPTAWRVWTGQIQGAGPDLMIQLFPQTLSALFTAGTQQMDSDLSRPVLSLWKLEGIALVPGWWPSMFNNLLPAGAGAQY